MNLKKAALYTAVAVIGTGTGAWIGHSQSTIEPVLELPAPGGGKLTGPSTEGTSAGELSAVNFNSTDFNWPNPARNILQTIKTMPPGLRRFDLMARVIQAVPDDLLLELLEGWPETDVGGTDLLLKAILTSANQLPVNKDRLLKLIKERKSGISSLERVALVMAPELQNDQACQKTLTQLILGNDDFAPIEKSTKLLRMIVSTPECLRLAVSSLLTPPSSAVITNHTLRQFENAVNGSSDPAILDLLKAFPNTSIARARQQSAIVGSFENGERSVDETLVEIGGASYAQEILENSLWQISEADPGKAISVAKNSSDAYFAKNLAGRIWNNWLRKDSAAAQRASREHGWVFDRQ